MEDDNVLVANTVPHKVPKFKERPGHIPYKGPLPLPSPVLILHRMYISL